MARVELTLPLGYYLDTSRAISIQTCKNFYPYILPAGVSGTRVALRGTPGISEFATTNDFSSRGMQIFKNKAYSVQGNTLYRININGTSDSLGTIVGSGLVSMASSDIQLCILVPGSTGYIFTSDPDTLTTISDGDFTANGNPQQVVFKDGYFLFYTDDNKIINSALNDGLTYDALDFGSAEANPDPINAIHISNNQLFVAGTTTTEVFQNVGGSGFPFQPVPGALIPKGIPATFSPVNADNTFFFIGRGENENNAVWRYSGGTIEKVSTGPIDAEIQALTNQELSEIVSHAYSEHEEYFVNFRLKNKTFCYGIVASANAGRPIWHERVSRSSLDTEINWRVNNIINIYSKILVADSETGKIGELSTDIYTEYTDRIISEAVLGPVISKGYSSIHSRLEVICEPGTSLISGDGSNAVIEMAYSDDMGFTFSDYREANLGAQGDRTARSIFYTLGRSARMRFYKLRISEPIKKSVLNVFLDIHTRS